MLQEMAMGLAMLATMILFTTRWGVWLACGMERMFYHNTAYTVFMRHPPDGISAKGAGHIMEQSLETLPST